MVVCTCERVNGKRANEARVKKMEGMSCFHAHVRVLLFCALTLIGVISNVDLGCHESRRKGKVSG